MDTVELIGDAIVDIPEGRHVELLLSDAHLRSRLFELYGNPKGVLDRQRVPLAGGFKGDADVLLIGPNRPEETVAIEVKKIKFGVRALRPRGQPNKLHELEKAIEQANLLDRVGFWKVYLYAIVVVDAREQNAAEESTGKLTFEGLSADLKSLAASVITTRGLNERIGLCHLEFAQTMACDPSVGTHGLQIVRRAIATQQGEGLTRWVADVFSK
jgi:hypothetical protein